MHVKILILIHYVSGNQMNIFRYENMRNDFVFFILVAQSDFA